MPNGASRPSSPWMVSGEAPRPRPAAERHRTPEPPPGRTLSGVFTKWGWVASIRPDRLCQLSGQSAVTAPDQTGGPSRRRPAPAHGTHRVLPQGDPRADPGAQRQPGPAGALRPRADLARRHRPPHRPHPHERRRAGRGPRGRGPGPRRRPRPEHRRQGPTLVALESDARTAIVLDLGERTFSAALANLRGELTTRRTRDLDGRDGDDALALVHELIDEVSREATSPILGIGVGTPGIVDAGGTIRWAVNLDWKDLPLADLLHDATATRRSSPTTPAPRPWPPSSSRARTGRPTSSRSRSGAASAPAWSSTATSSVATATARARSATSSWSPTAPSATAAASAASRRRLGARDPAGRHRRRPPGRHHAPRAGRRGRRPATPPRSP